MFSTLMFERHRIKIATFGGKPGETMEYKGMAGNQVLEFADLKTEIKTAQLNDVSAGCSFHPSDGRLTSTGSVRILWRRPICSSTVICV